MIATHNPKTPKNHLSVTSSTENCAASQQENERAISVKNLNHHSQLLLPGRLITHHPKAGLNPLVDAAGYLFSVIGKLKHLKSYRHLDKLQKELIQEVNLFQDTVKNYNYNAEHIVVCRYVLCATFDDIIANMAWSSQGQWDNYGLLAAFNQDPQHQDKFFTIMERAIKDSPAYIDLMEFMYICLSMGYKGQYRSTEHNQYQLEQITNNLYKHIQAYRGSFSKTLSPTPFKTLKPTIKTKYSRNPSLTFVFFVTACVIMTIFISLGYLMDVISNEAYKNFSPIESPLSPNHYRS